MTSVGFFPAQLAGTNPLVVKRVKGNEQRGREGEIPDELCMPGTKIAKEACEEVEEVVASAQPFSS